MKGKNSSLKKITAAEEKLPKTEELLASETQIN